MPCHPDEIVVAQAGATVYRLYDVGYEIDLGRASGLLAPLAPPRAHPGPRRGEAAAILTPTPPLIVDLGSDTIEPAGGPVTATVSAAVFDFGVVSVRLHLPAAARLAWRDFVRFAVALHDSGPLRRVLDRRLAELIGRINAAIQRPSVAAVTEDYIVFRIAHLETAGGEPCSPTDLDDHALASLLLNEPRELSPSARRELLPHRFAYTARDFAALTWESALVIEPVPEDRDIEYILEFANAQLLELRVFDAALDAELPRMYDRIAAVRHAPYGLLRRRYRHVLAGLQTLVADTTEIVERVENALKVTDDVYLARVYSAALEIFRGAAWRQGVDRKLGIIRDTYAMLNAESQAARGEALEVAIVLLILAELLLPLFGRR